jgi:5'-AMP-activated protein kinase regulatory gamma subunit
METGTAHLPRTDQQGNILLTDDRLEKGKQKLAHDEVQVADDLAGVIIEDQVSWPLFIKQYTAKDLLVPFSSLVQLKSTDTVRTTLWTLIKHKIQSLPVYNEKTGRYVGMVDVFDLVQYICNKAGDSLFRPDFFQGFKHRAYADEPVSKIINLSNRDHWYTVMDSAALDSILDMMVSSNVHRVPVIDTKRRVIGLITQSRVVDFLASHVEAFPYIANKKIHEFGLANAENVYTIRDDMASAKAFMMMIEKGVRGIAVVNAQDQLVDAVSASDIKGLIYGDFFSDLRSPVLRYLSKVRILLGRNLGPIYCVGEDTVVSVLKKLSQEKVHRIFVVDEDKKPIHVISLRDILRVMAGYSHPLV